MKEYLIFDLLDGLYAIELRKVKSILVYSQVVISKLFNEKKWVRGVINLRGEVTPVIDLRIRFGDDNPVLNENTVIIIVKTAEDKLVGIVIDQISIIKELNHEAISHTPEIGVGIDQKYISGLANSDNKLITILNVDKILNIAELTD